MHAKNYTQHDYDLVVVGAGIVGLAAGYTLQNRFPDSKIALVDKESTIAQHQSTHNSGVIHTGVFYEPGSQKSKNCTAGRLLLEEFCTEHRVPFKTTGKVIVACEESEREYLSTIYERSQKNGVRSSMITREELQEIEPYVQGIEALHVPDAGVIHFPDVCEKLSEIFLSRGGVILTHSRIQSATRTGNKWQIACGASTIESKFIVNCTGLHSDRVARLFGLTPDVQIIPFRGEYYILSERAAEFCKTLVYPVPNPLFPFLGVHLTRSLSGLVDCGPSAVLAFSREGYTVSTVNAGDMIELGMSARFWKMALAHWQFGLKEFTTSFSRASFLSAVQRLVPQVEGADLRRGPAGVRAQAVAKDGSLVSDFVFERQEGALHVLNAPSPAATSCLAIGRTVAEQIEL